MSAAVELRVEGAVAPDLLPCASSDGGQQFDLLVACCAMDGQTRMTRELLSQPLDWSRFVAMAEHHGVIPRVYERLSKMPEAVPVGPLDALRLRYQENARKALWFTNELLRLLDHLELRGIETLPHKGPVLAQVLYGDVTRRQFSDLDIFVRAADVIKAKNALSELGYRPSIDLGPREEQAYIDAGYEYSFNGPHGHNLLEVQWQVLPRFYAVDFDLSNFLKRSQSVNLAGHGVRTLCAQDLFLVLCVHAAKHVWWRLSWLCDIAELATSQPLDWDEIRSESQRLGIERIVTVNLILAEKLCRVSLPVRAMRMLDAHPAARTFADEMLPLIACSEPYDTESISYFHLMMRLRERWQDRTRLLLRLAFTPNVGEWKTVRLPQQLFGLYGLVRLLRLVKRLTSKSTPFRGRQTAGSSKARAELPKARNENTETTQSRLGTA